MHFCFWLSGCFPGRKSMPQMKVIFNFILRPLLPRHSFPGMPDKNFGNKPSLLPRMLTFYKASLKKVSPSENISDSNNGSHRGHDWGENLIVQFVRCLVKRTWKPQTNTFLFLKLWSLLPNQSLYPSYSVTSLHGLKSKGVNELGTHQVDIFSQQKLPLHVQSIPPGPQMFSIWLQSLKHGLKVK